MEVAKGRSEEMNEEQAFFCIEEQAFFSIIMKNIRQQQQAFSTFPFPSIRRDC